MVMKNTVFYCFGMWLYWLSRPTIDHNESRRAILAANWWHNEWQGRLDYCIQHPERGETHY